MRDLKNKEIIDLILFGIGFYIVLGLISLRLYGLLELPLLVFYIIPSIGAVMIYIAFKEAFKKKEKKEPEKKEWE